MKGGRARPYNYNIDEDMMDEDNERIMYPRLIALGFDDAELEALFVAERELTEDIIINTYLEVARSRPYCQNWQTESDAAAAADNINVERYPGRNYEKRDIARYVYGLISDRERPVLEPCGGVQGGYKRKNRRTRKNKKTRTNKRRGSNKRRRRNKYLQDCL